VTSPGAIVGLGMTEMGKVYGKSANDFAEEAVVLAAANAGLPLDAIDGLLVNAGAKKSVTLKLQKRLGLRDLRFGAEVQSFGSSAGVMVQTACLAIEAGLVDVVACVFADDPLTAGASAGDTYSGSARKLVGLDEIAFATGVRGAPINYALAARRHMQVFGTTSEDLAAVAVSTRAWACLNPAAQMRTPLTIEAHQQSRMVADPFRLLDCCLVSNGAIAVIVTSSSRAKDLASQPVYVRGFGQSHPGYPMDKRSTFGLQTGARLSGEQALKMADSVIQDVDMAQLYDCFTFTTLASFEDYGFCEKGEAGDVFRSGATAPGGSIPVNTGGGQLSSYYMWGMTPLSEAVIQIRGEGGARQVGKPEVVLVSGNGGALDFHSTLILSPND
jgi:acetyl-CoA acetyltransferase